MASAVISALYSTNFFPFSIVLAGGFMSKPFTLYFPAAILCSVRISLGSTVATISTRPLTSASRDAESFVSAMKSASEKTLGLKGTEKISEN